MSNPKTIAERKWKEEHYRAVSVGGTLAGVELVLVDTKEPAGVVRAFTLTAEESEALAGELVLQAQAHREAVEADQKRQDEQARLANLAAGIKPKGDEGT
jgi:hypothetical protein